MIYYSKTNTVFYEAIQYLKGATLSDKCVSTVYVATVHCERRITNANFQSWTYVISCLILKRESDFTNILCIRNLPSNKLNISNPRAGIVSGTHCSTPACTYQSAQSVSLIALLGCYCTSYLTCNGGFRCGGQIRTQLHLHLPLSLSYCRRWTFVSGSSRHFILVSLLSCRRGVVRV